MSADVIDLGPDPLTAFDRWFAEAREKSGAELPEACCLASVDADGYPDARMVLLKARDAKGFVFYTNYNSVKGRSLAEEPRAAMTFFWEKLHRQVRIQGDVERVSAAESDEYFASRPRGSQLGAWASEQSAAIESREALMRLVASVTRKYEGGPVPRPSYWGGLRIVPRRVEFWQGMPDRLHDRVVYRREKPGSAWRMERLQP